MDWKTDRWIEAPSDGQTDGLKGRQTDGEDRRMDRRDKLRSDQYV